MLSRNKRNEIMCIKYSGGEVDEIVRKVSTFKSCVNSDSENNISIVCVAAQHAVSVT